MSFQENDLKDIWARSDTYFQFRYTEFKTFGSRLKKWRELNNISLRDMAEIIYYYRKKLGLENNKISQELLQNETTKDMPINYEIEVKREKRINNLLHTYYEWETKKGEAFSSNTPFSMTNLRILKRILNCDYEFLFCEIDTPHRHTDEIAEQTGLNISTIEKLLSYSRIWQDNTVPPLSSMYAHCILTTLNKLISDDDFMTYVSYYLTSTSGIFDENDNIEHDNFYTISVVHPLSGSPTLNAAISDTVDNLDFCSIHLVYLVTIANKLCHLKEKNKEDSANIILSPDNLPSLTQVLLAEDNDSFGDRLRKWRTYKHYTQDYVAELIYSYRKKHNLTKTVKGISYIPEKNSILRTYQNWESKLNTTRQDIQNIQDTRLSMSDLFILKHIMKCDYEYLFGEINTLTVSQNSIYGSLGLSSNNVQKLKKYAQSITGSIPDTPAYAANILSSINLIVSNDSLLSSLAYFLSDIPFSTDMKCCNILKPIKIHGISLPAQDEYADYLFPDNKEMRNIFLPTILYNLVSLKIKNVVSLEPLPPKTINILSQFISSLGNLNPNL